MTIIDRIDKMTVEGIYGKQKSQTYLGFIKKVKDAKKDADLTKILKSIEVQFKGKTITQDEMMDLLDKIDKKKIK